MFDHERSVLVDQNRPFGARTRRIASVKRLSTTSLLHRRVDELASNALPSRPASFFSESTPANVAPPQAATEAATKREDSGRSFIGKGGEQPSRRGETATATLLDPIAAARSLRSCSIVAQRRSRRSIGVGYRDAPASYQRRRPESAISSRTVQWTSACKHPPHESRSRISIRPPLPHRLWRHRLWRHVDHRRARRRRDRRRRRRDARRDRRRCAGRERERRRERLRPRRCDVVPWSGDGQRVRHVLRERVPWRQSGARSGRFQLHVQLVLERVQSEHVPSEHGAAEPLHRVRQARPRGRLPAGRRCDRAVLDVVQSVRRLHLAVRGLSYFGTRRIASKSRGSCRRSPSCRSCA